MGLAPLRHAHNRSGGPRARGEYHRTPSRQPFVPPKE